MVHRMRFLQARHRQNAQEPSKKDISIWTLMKSRPLGKAAGEMGEQWIEECNEYLRRMRETTAENPDRLEVVRSMHTALLAINHSTLGWLQYVNNPDIMSLFDLEELTEIRRTLNKFAEAYVLNDIEVTRKGIRKGMDVAKQDGEAAQPFYV